MGGAISIIEVAGSGEKDIFSPRSFCLRVIFCGKGGRGVLEEEEGPPSLRSGEI